MKKEANITFGHLYHTYKNHNAHFGVETFDCAESTVRALLSRDTPTDHPGILLGKVQSGKTRTFITVMALAFDNQFDVCLILTKNSTALAKQTYQRVEQEFSRFIDEDRVDVYDIMSVPQRFTSYELNKKIVIVAKKETKNLDRLQELFHETAPELSRKKILIVDDEADFASVGFKRERGAIASNTIPLKINRLRTHLNSSYLQVTATPYSLYLQPEDIQLNGVTEFRPIRPSFTRLVPTPESYIGGDFYFGERARMNEPTIENQMHVEVTEREVLALVKEDRRRLPSIDDALTSMAIPKIRRAIVSFVMGGCFLHLADENKGEGAIARKFSFLFHTEQKKQSHSWQEDVVTALVDQTKTAITQGHPIFDFMVRDSYDDLSQSMRTEGLDVPAFEVVVERVKEAFCSGKVMITKVNSDQQIADMLDRSGQLKLRCPFNIFIGGQILDRGVTLNNLLGFYYGRRPQKSQQDTVLQHSRMFGYRPRKDLCVTRFYTLRTILERLFDIEEFDSALRDAIENGSDGSVQFIRQCASGRIVPCSPNKILISQTRTIRPFKRLLPIGFQIRSKTRVAQTIADLDNQIDGFLKPGLPEEPQLIDVNEAIAMLHRIETTMEFREQDGYYFDWKTCRNVLRHLSFQTAMPEQRGKAWILVRKGRNMSREASEGSHARFIETPETASTDGRKARETAMDHPLLMLLRQEGHIDSGWSGTPFYWPIVYAQGNTQAVVYAENVGDAD